jgi:hypothetical protein
MRKARFAEIVAPAAVQVAWGAVVHFSRTGRLMITREESVAAPVVNDVPLFAHGPGERDSWEQ